MSTLEKALEIAINAHKGLVEDSAQTFESLKKEGFSEDIISVLKCITKESDNEDYDTFINRVIQNPIAVKVKINDLLDNMDITRLKELNEGGSYLIHFCETNQFHLMNSNTI